MSNRFLVINQIKSKFLKIDKIRKSKLKLIQKTMFQSLFQFNTKTLTLGLYNDKDRVNTR